MSRSQNIGIASMIVLIADIMIWWEYSLWSECRVDHSFFYCLRVLGK